MIKYFCDLCGEETVCNENAAGPAAELCGLYDLCPRCHALAKGLDIAQLAMTDLRRLAANAEADAPEVDAIPAAGITGRGAAEKRDILAALEGYRREHGFGCIPQLAQQAGVSEEALRDMIDRKKVPLSAWRAVGRALGTASAEAKGRPVTGAAAHD